MSLEQLTDWLNAWNRPDTLWYAKRLAANDTLATKAHQAGPYIPRQLLFRVFPSLNKPQSPNPERWFSLLVDSHGEQRDVRAIWYNNRLSGGTRNEARITNFGGRASPLLDPESTGALAVFVFVLGPDGEALVARVWLASDPTEEELIEGRIGPVEPGVPVIWSPAVGASAAVAVAPRRDCRLGSEEIPPLWKSSFPTGREIIRRAIELRSDSELAIDTRLLRRRECEYELFLSVEEAIEMPRIREGFGNIDEFVARAQTILQRRKARSGRSLELHTFEILVEEGFKEGESFSHQPESEGGKRPDFLFPSELAYKNRTFSSTDLRMLAVKTTCKDRWRQILNEADRVRVKHLLTLQEGVSENQFKEMTEGGVALVVPAPLHESYPASVRPKLISPAAFVQEIRGVGT